MILDESQSAILDFSVISTSEESNSIEFKKAIDAYITHLNGSWPIYKILIANNGLAALKKIKSIRKWCFSTFGYSQAIKLLVMATTDDLEANAEYIRLADGYIEVPSGTNNFNYANVDLIVQLAQKYCVQAVWAGWGHASENPQLPTLLSACNPPIAFIGPSARPMKALGDKISSMILAQSAGVSTCKWSGTGIVIDKSQIKDRADFIDDRTYLKACCNNLEDGINILRNVGLPVMIKASEGGGGKGIRKVEKEEQFKKAFLHVQNEVPGSPIFIMKMAENSRHLEIQLVCDKYGNATTLYGRDCSVQRRHQKIIEEAPISIAPKEIILQMEEEAVRLGKLVGYENVGTVEFLYNPADNSYLFLELNPRLQVEHPTSEMVTDVNIPALQLMITMGIPLFRIPDIRRLYGEDPKQSNSFSLDLKRRLPPKGHVIAARITAENTDNGFQPNGGELKNVKFPGNCKSWGYFAVYSNGKIHNFSDSHFGHIFSHGSSREDASQILTEALQETSIDAGFCTNLEYVTALINHPVFQTNNHTTNWLDSLIQDSYKPPKHKSEYIALCAASMLSFEHLIKQKAQLQESLKKRQYPTSEQLKLHTHGKFIYDGLEYNFKAFPFMPSQYRIILGDNEVLVSIFQCRDGSFMVSFCNFKFSVQFNQSNGYFYLIVNGSSYLIEFQNDPSSIKSPSSGRLIKFLVEDGEEVGIDTAIAEMEVMKMYSTVYSKASGTISLKRHPGSTLLPGDLIASLTLSEQAEIGRIPIFSGHLPLEQSKEMSMSTLCVFKKSLLMLRHALSGYDIGQELDQVIRNLFESTEDKSLLVLKLKEVISAHQSKIPAQIIKESTQLLNSYQSDSKESFYRLKDSLVKFNYGFGHEFEKIFSDHQEFNFDYTMTLFLECVHLFVSREKIFESSATVDGTLSQLFELYHNDLEVMANHVWSHSRLDYRMSVILSILDIFLEIQDGKYIKHPEFLSALKTLSSLSGKEYGKLVRRSRELLLTSQLPSLSNMIAKMESKFEAASKLIDSPEKKTEFINEMVEGFSTHLDVLPHFFHHFKPEIRQLAFEIYIRRLFGPHIINGSCLLYDAKTDVFEWDFSTEPNISISDSPPLGDFCKDSNVPTSNRRKGFMISISSKDDFVNALKMLRNKIVTNVVEEETVYYIVFKETFELKEMEMKQFVQEMLQKNANDLKQHQIRRITLAVVRKNGANVGFYTFRKSHEYHEDATIRHIEPAMAYLLEYHRLFNYDIQFCFSDISGQVRILLGTEKESKAQNRRLFIRLVIRPNQAMKNFDNMEHFGPEANRILEEVLEAVEAVQAQNKQTFECNHLFINIVPVFYNQPDDVLYVFKELVKQSQQRWSELHISQAEVRMNLSKGKGQPAVRYRFFLSNKTGYVSQISGYIEKKDNNSGFKWLSSLENTHRGRFHGYPVSFRYPCLTSLQMKRNRVQDLGTPYVYDFPILFEYAISNAWAGAEKNGSISSASSRPDQYLECKELVLERSGNSNTLIEHDRKAGYNSCGMVAWKMKVFTPEASSGREIIVIANDISFEIGSFGIEEDRLFYEASKLARSLGIPRIYFSANSGARIGLADELKGLFKISWKDDENPLLGFDYIYLTEDDYCSINPSIVNCEQLIMPNGEVRYIIRDIIGAKNGLGVENLQGSALIAGETSLAYDEIFTLSVATCRSVGIGAYLIRLGQRVIQKENQPIILTGVGALNNLLGREVYRNNLQIGGPQIMHVNGISHRIVKDDIQGIEEVIKWLSFVPLANELPIPPKIFSSDPTEREIEYIPPLEGEYDPRWLIEGKTTDQGWIGGLVDKGSFVEYLAGWAKTVVIGRARLGGIPVGVIGVETRSTELVIPADPANPQSEAQVTRQAGQVWFPDSAFKTAQAIRDFTKGEHLPIIILANWRGFSGGQRDLFDQILKFGSQIVDALKAADQPIFIYLPPGAELRGGAWVVLDSQINPDSIEMFADPSSRGGVLEPEGIIGIKFKQEQLYSIMDKLDPICKDLNDLMESRPENSQDLLVKLQSRKTKLAPIYRQIAHHFADAHDRPGRMKAKNVIKDIVPWPNARKFFFFRLQRRLSEREFYFTLVPEIRNRERLNQAILASCGSKYYAVDDECAFNILKAKKTEILSLIAEINNEHKRRTIQDLVHDLPIDIVKSLLQKLNI